MAVLEVQNLCKHYEHFDLDSVSFSVREGSIMGFIGRNGAGKTTTLKSLLNLVHPNAGNIRFFGMDFAEHEQEIKQRIGFVSGGVDYYTKKKIRTITSVTKRFYPTWDDSAYRKYLQMFELDESKTPEQLSAGMKVKYSLALALSHHAELLILDEPTSGLDPVSRDDLLDVFLQLEDNGVGILFSTHITSDLDKCADDVTYIKHGHILASDSLKGFTDRYRFAELEKEQLTPMLEPLLIGCKRSKTGFTALLAADAPTALESRPATLEEIMVHLEKEDAE